MLPNQHSRPSAQRKTMILSLHWMETNLCLSSPVVYVRQYSGCPKFRKKYSAPWLCGGHITQHDVWGNIGSLFFFLVQVKHLTSLNTFPVESSFIILINTVLSWLPSYISNRIKKKFQHLLLFCCCNVDILFGSSINIHGLSEEAWQRVCSFSVGLHSQNSYNFWHQSQGRAYMSGSRWAR